MEIASDELITEAEKERTRKVLDDLCAEVSELLTIEEARATARAIFHDAVSAAAKSVAETIAGESVPAAREIVMTMLRDGSQHPYVEAAVVEAAQPVARCEAYAAIRRWSEEKALPKAELEARKIYSQHIENGCLPVIQVAVMAGIRVILENHITANPQISTAERERLMDEYLAGEARKSATEAMARALTAELRRKAQRCAEIAVEEVAAQATDSLAREDALAAAKLVAIDTAKVEISRLVLAEAQRRAARLAREFLQVEAANLDEDKRAEYCQEIAQKVAEEAVKSVTEEIADPSVADLDLERARELALSAASAVAREFSGAYLITQDQDSSRVSTKTLVFLAAQIFTGCFIVWFFLLGGYETCEPMMKAVLPPSWYLSIYRAVPARHHQNAPEKDSKGGIDDDLLEDTKAGVENDGVPDVKPAEGVQPLPGANNSNQSSSSEKVPGSSPEKAPITSSSSAPPGSTKKGETAASEPGASSKK